MVKNAFGFPVVAMVSHIPVKSRMAVKFVNPDRAESEYGRTPLSWAAVNGHERVVRMLLEQKDVNPTTQIPKVAGHHSRWWLGTGMRRCSRCYRNHCVYRDRCQGRG